MPADMVSSCRKAIASGRQLRVVIEGVSDAAHDGKLAGLLQRAAGDGDDLDVVESFQGPQLATSPSRRHR